jgi:hypothetical protein
VKGAHRNVTVQSLRNYLVEATDTVTLAYRDGVVETHIVDRTVIDLTLAGTTFETRLVATT